MILAGVQMDVRFAEPGPNREAMAAWHRRAREQKADVTLFPECATTGYCYESRDEALPLAEPIPGPTTEFFQSLCGEVGGTVAFGLLERDGDSLFNAAVLVGAGGVIASYRKVHLPYLGVDRFVDFGERTFVVKDMALPGGEPVRFGLNICYDSGFPEASRVLALAGADLILLPTNWPTGAELLAEHAIPTRALENAIYYAAVNRVGSERGFRFIGGSRICDPTGKTLAAGPAEGEALLVAEIDPARARNKTVVRVPGKHLIDRLADRRPEFYGPLIDPTGRAIPGRDVPAEYFG